MKMYIVPVPRCHRYPWTSLRLCLQLALTSSVLGIPFVSVSVTWHCSVQFRVGVRVKCLELNIGTYSRAYLNSSHLAYAGCRRYKPLRNTCPFRDQQLVVWKSVSSHKMNSGRFLTCAVEATWKASTMIFSTWIDCQGCDTSQKEAHGWV